jgi:hypothetical protein
MNSTDQQTQGPAGRQDGPDAFKTALDKAGGQVLAAHTRLEGCEIVGLIGAGASSIVYLAYDYALARQVAVKEYFPDALAARGANGRVGLQAGADRELFEVGRRSFLSEARLLARFEAPSLVKILRFWEANGTAYMAMPFHDGISLQEAVGSGRFDANEKRIRSLLEQLFETVDMLHRADCYHPDIAPGNILLLADGRPLLMDFGAARRVLAAHTGGPAAALRPGYAPIEDYEDIPNLKRGPWTDVYALAAVAYFAIVGAPPPPAVSRMARDTMTPAGQAGAARYGEPFLAAIDKALAVMPQQRIQSVAEFRRALGMPAQRKGAGPVSPADGADVSTLRWPEAAAGRAAQPQAARQGRPAWAGGRSGPAKVALPLLALALAAAAYWGVQRTDPAATTTTTTTTTVAGAADPAAAVAGNAGDPPDPAAASAPASGEPAASTGQPMAMAPSAVIATPEDSRWLVASSLNNASAYENYLADYPNGRYAPMARAALDGLRAGEAQALSVPDVAMQEESLWNAVRKIDKPLAYESFLRKYPNGRHAAAARNSLARLRPSIADPRPVFDAPVVDATRRPPFSGGPYNAPADRPPAVTPPVASVAPAAPAAPAAVSAPPAPERLAATRQAEPPPAQRAPLPAEPAAEVEPEPETPALPQASRTGRTLRVANQTMTGNFSPDPATGLVSGNGRIVWDNGDRFEGTMVRGIKEGKGEFLWANGQRYRGDWSRDQPNGKGTIQFPNGDRYTGDMRNGLPNGAGTLVFANGNRYQGEVRDGQPNGSGSLTFSNGNRYRGEVRDGLPQGTGSIRFANGDSYSGTWRRGRSDGQGRYTWANGSYWEGEFRDDVKTANGRMVQAGDAPGVASAATSGESPRGSSAGEPADVGSNLGDRVR